ncbi:MAG: hypothetical protein JOY71_03055, partial [Acetobacteraceae bacterium]|nr:hypothetical protein [Acetobacteraceae bacterium]
GSDVPQAVAESAPAPVGDANVVAAAVESVLKRELPSLVWKVMAEMDLERRKG